MEGVHQYRDPEMETDLSDNADLSAGTPFGSPYQDSSSQNSPHQLVSGLTRRRSSARSETDSPGRAKPDGYFIGDSCLSVSSTTLSSHQRFGSEFRFLQNQHFDFTSPSRAAREWDYTAIKFRVLKEQPTYKFGLKDGMLCNVYEHDRVVRHQNELLWVELCAPYIEVPEASLYAMNNAVFQPINNDIARADTELQEGEARIMLLLRGFEAEAGSAGARMFIGKGNTVSLQTPSGSDIVKCIGHGQCATVWQPGDYRLVFRRYGGHTYNSATEQAAVQQASNTIHEQLAHARDLRRDKLKQVEDIGLPNPMSLFSTRVLSRFLIQPSQDGHYALYEVQPLIPSDELVEHFLLEFAQLANRQQEAASLTTKVPLYRLRMGPAERDHEYAVKSYGYLWTVIIKEILEQLLTVSKNLEEYRKSHDGEDLLGIGIDSKIANYQVRFAYLANHGSPGELRAFLANYDGYPPNLTLFNKETVLFKGGPLYDLLNEYFRGFGFTNEFVTRSMNLTTLEKQALKMLASVASETAQHDPGGRVLQFTLEIVNRWLREQRSQGEEVTTWTLEDIKTYQEKSGRYHRAVRLHLLAAELGWKVNPKVYGVRSADFPVNDNQADWLSKIRTRFSSHIMAFFHLNEIDKLEQFLIAILDYDFNASSAETHRKLSALPTDVVEIVQTVQTLLESGGQVFGDVVHDGDVETMMELLSDVFDQQRRSSSNLLVSGTRALPARMNLHRCQHTGSCSHSQREHALFHFWLERFFLYRSFSINESDVKEPLQGARHRIPQFELQEMLQRFNLGLEVVSEHHSRRSLLATLLQVPEARLLAGFRNALHRLQRQGGAKRQEHQAETLEQLLGELSETLRLGGLDSNRNILLLNSLLLDRDFIVLEGGGVSGRDGFVIRQYQLHQTYLQDKERVTLELNSKLLNSDDLRSLVQRMSIGEDSPHYFIFRGSKAGDWYILRPQWWQNQIDGDDDLNPVMNPDVSPSPLFLALARELRRPPRTTTASNMSHARLQAYRQALLEFLKRYEYITLPPPPNDNHCLFHALTVILGVNDQKMSKEVLMRKLRHFLAKLLLQVNLGESYEDHLTGAELMLINQIGPTALVDMLDELSVTEDAQAGPYHQQTDVWGDYNMILIAAVAFDIDIPFTFFNLHNPGGNPNDVMEHNFAMHNGTVPVLDVTQQQPPVMIVFGEHANHWEVVVQNNAEDLVIPHVPWINTPSPTQFQHPQDQSHLESANSDGPFFPMEEFSDISTAGVPPLATSDMLTLFQDLRGVNEFTLQSSLESQYEQENLPSGDIGHQNEGAPVFPSPGGITAGGLGHMVPPLPEQMEGVETGASGNDTNATSSQEDVDKLIPVKVLLDTLSSIWK